MMRGALSEPPAGLQARPGTYVPPRGQEAPSRGTGNDLPFGNISTPPPRRHADNAARPANLGPGLRSSDISGE